MADFTRQREFTTREPQITVDKTLPVGAHTFQLVVVDNTGNKSRPVRVTVQVVRAVIIDGPVIR